MGLKLSLYLHHKHKTDTYMNNIPDSYLSKDKIACYTLLIPLYSFFFLIGVKPFHLDIFMQVTQGQLAFRAAIMASIEIGVVLLSRLPMLLAHNHHQLRYTGYIVWELLEGLAISMFCTLFIWLMSKREMAYIELLPKMFLITYSILLFPYVIVALISEIQDRNRRLAKDQITIEKYQSGQIGRQDSTLPFLDEKKSLKLAVTAASVLYIEAADNYVNICYLNNDKLIRFPLRNSMKSIEQICESNNIVRCHRSYYVNVRKVRAIKRTSEGVYTELDYAAAPRIPVSGKYADSFIGKYSQLNG